MNCIFAIVMVLNKLACICYVRVSKIGIIAMDRLTAMKLHMNTANKWLLMAQGK